jgi:hypothetical protein
MAHVFIEGALCICPFSNELRFSLQNLLKYSITKLNKNLTSGSLANTCREERMCGHDAANIRSSRLHPDEPKSAWLIVGLSLLRPRLSLSLICVLFESDKAEAWQVLPRALQCARALYNFILLYSCLLSVTRVSYKAIVPRDSVFSEPQNKVNIEWNDKTKAQML